MRVGAHPATLFSIPSYRVTDTPVNISYWKDRKLWNYILAFKSFSISVAERKRERQPWLYILFCFIWCKWGFLTVFTQLNSGRLGNSFIEKPWLWGIEREWLWMNIIESELHYENWSTSNLKWLTFEPIHERAWENGMNRVYDPNWIWRKTVQNYHWLPYF